MSERYRELVEGLRTAVLTGAGVTTGSTRAAVASRAAALSGSRTPTDGVVPPTVGVRGTGQC